MDDRKQRAPIWALAVFLFIPVRKTITEFEVELVLERPVLELRYVDRKLTAWFHFTEDGTDASREVRPSRLQVPCL